MSMKMTSESISIALSTEKSSNWISSCSQNCWMETMTTMSKGSSPVSRFIHKGPKGHSGYAMLSPLKCMVDQIHGRDTPGVSFWETGWTKGPAMRRVGPAPMTKRSRWGSWIQTWPSGFDEVLFKDAISHNNKCAVWRSGCLGMAGLPVWWLELANIFKIHSSTGISESGTGSWGAHWHSLNALWNWPWNARCCCWCENWLGAAAQASREFN